MRDTSGNYVGPMINWERITDQVRAQESEQQLRNAQIAAEENLRHRVNQLMQVVSAIANGDLDHVAEQAFFNVGGLDMVMANWDRIQKETK